MSQFKQSWRKPNPHKHIPEAGSVDYPATKFFDNLSYIGNSTVGCFLVETSEGLILLDNMRPNNAEYIDQEIRSLGFDPADLKAILITHGHADHFGNAVYFRDKYNTKLYMSEIDERFGMDAEAQGGRPYMKFRVDGYLEDNGEFTLGDTTIHTFLTPGHTPGCMSFIFQVFDEGRPHVAAIWGGTGVPKAMEDRKKLFDSCVRFADISLKYGCDVAISAHQYVDMTLKKLDIIRNIIDGVANPFVLGYEGYHRFEMMLYHMYENSLKV